jgi:UDP-glucose 4-epimerase
MSVLPNILLTGATGFLGSHLLEALLEKGCKVIILKRSTSDTWRINHLLEQVKSYNVDYEVLHSIFEEQNIDYVMHLATLYRKFDNGLEIKEMMDSNVLFPTELLELSVKYKVKGFINTGTFFEYDCSKLPVDEYAEINPFNLYAKTKLAFETILKTYSNTLNITTLKLFSPYGEKDNGKLIPMIISKALVNEKIELSDGLQKLDFIYEKDIVDAYLCTIRTMEKKQGSGYSVYNIGSGMSISIREIVSIIEQQLNKPLNKVWGNVSKVDIPIAFADISKAIADLEWSPQHSIQEGIAKTIAYYKEESK